MKKKVIVIGSGFGGLAAATRLVAQGHEVTLLEKRDKSGGRAYVYEMDGFKFDAGPTVVTIPQIFDDIFTRAGRSREDYVQLVKCQPFYRIFNHEGKFLEYNDDEQYILTQIDKWNPGDKENYQRFMLSIKAIFDAGMALVDKPFLSIWDMMRVVPDLLWLRAYKSVYQYASEFFENDFLRRCFSFHPLLIGGNPLDATSIYALIHYAEREWGVLYSVGGTGAMIQALEKLFVELGGIVRHNSEVDEILIEQSTRKVTGVRTTIGDIIPSDVVVSNADVAFTYRSLIPERYRRIYTNRKIEGMKYSMSLFVLYFGTKRRYNNGKLVHHNIILSDRYEELLKDIFDRKVLAEDFSLYLHMPTFSDPSVAPDGCEAFYVLSPVPNLGSDVNWAEVGKSYRDKIVQFLEQNYLPDLESNIIVEHSVDPVHFQDELNSYLGAGFSLQPILTQSAWFRPHNRSEEFSNLYFVGAGTHPGAGLPGVLFSAKVVADLIGFA